MDWPLNSRAAVNNQTTNLVQDEKEKKREKTSKRKKSFAVVGVLRLFFLF